MHKPNLIFITIALAASPNIVAAQSGGVQRISNFASGTAGWQS